MSIQSTSKGKDYLTPGSDLKKSPKNVKFEAVK
jgi:hypothetical protein